MLHRMTICRWLGHKREHYYVDGVRWNRRGYWQPGKVHRVKCVRCGAGGDTSYESGAFERWRDWWRDLVEEIERYHVPARDPDSDGLPF